MARQKNERPMTARFLSGNQGTQEKKTPGACGIRREGFMPGEVDLVPSRRHGAFWGLFV